MTFDDEIRALEVLDLEQLRAIWRARYGPSPKLRSPDLLRQMLAWRLQADRLGGLSPSVKRALSRAGAARDTRRGLGQGARMSREWRGRRYDVDLVDGGFVYDGRTFKSLSEIAREITGVRWNGPRFFGLRQEKAA